MTTIPSSLFSSNGNCLFAEASDLYAYLSDPLFEESSLTVKSDRTGRVVKFNYTGEVETDSDNDVTAWYLRPTHDADLMNSGVCIMVFND